MKKIISEPQLTNTIEVRKVLNAQSYQFIGYESEGGLRTMLTRKDNTYGFVYSAENQGLGMTFSASTKQEAMRKAMRSGRQLVVTEDPREFMNWYMHSIPTRRGVKHLVDLMWSNNISILDLIKEAYDSSPFDQYRLKSIQDYLEYNTAICDFKPGDHVMVYDRYRFTNKGLRCKVHLVHRDGVQLTIMEHRTSEYKPGVIIWACEQQLRHI